MIARLGIGALMIAAGAMPAAAASAVAGPVTAAVVPAPSWWACADDPGVECATLTVPLDHHHPDERTIRLPVRRLPARDPSSRVGVLVAISGGPGQRGTDLVVRRRYSPAILDAFDIVGWDPRGTSGETLIDCIPEWDPFDDVDRTPDTRAERAALDERISSLAEHCRKRHGSLLPFVGTLETALDLERLRVFLGEPSISLLGTSYGSKVAVVYATLFPERVRAAVLDGYADANQTPAARDLEQAAAFERALDGLLADCDADAGCPLGDAAGAGDALDALLAALDEGPLDVGDGRVLTQADAYEAIAAALVRNRPARTRLLGALADAAAGDGAALHLIAETSRDAFASSGLTLGAFAAISCADDAAFWRSLDAVDVAAHVEQVHRAAPRLGTWLVPASSRASATGLCAMQPRADGLPHVGFDAAGAGPILVIATTGDPTTPLSAARRALGDLERASLVEVAAEHHTAVGFAVADGSRPYSACVVDAVERALIEPTVAVPPVACP